MTDERLNLTTDVADTELSEGKIHTWVMMMFEGRNVPEGFENRLSRAVSTEARPVERTWLLILLAWCLSDKENRTAALNYLDKAHRLACDLNLPHARNVAERLTVFYAERDDPKLIASMRAIIAMPGMTLETAELFWRCLVGTKHDPRDDPRGSWADRLRLP
ncbi:MAG TPA: hypothetical protein VLG40_01795 [Candidatus Saccharimonas sp.]|nr:hypothetical protein [Candidatus Saccharimonas sp.]